MPPPGAAAAFEDHACELHGCSGRERDARGDWWRGRQRAYVWDVSYPTCVPKQRLEAHSEVVAAVAITEDGRQVATAGRDNIVVLWVEEGRDYKNILTLKGHTSWVSSVVFSSGGHYLGTGSYDETARVWSCTSGKELAMFHDDDVSNDRGKPFVYDVAFSYDAKSIAGRAAATAWAEFGTATLKTRSTWRSCWSRSKPTPAPSSPSRGRPTKRIRRRRRTDVQGLLGEEWAHSIGPDRATRARSRSSNSTRRTAGACSTGGSRRPCPWRRRRAMPIASGASRRRRAAWTPRKEANGTRRAGPFCGATSTALVASLDATGAGCSSRRASIASVTVWDVQRIKLGTAELPVVPRRRDGGRADGGWCSLCCRRASLLCCLRATYTLA